MCFSKGDETEIFERSKRLIRSPDQKGREENQNMVIEDNSKSELITLPQLMGQLLDKVDELRKKEEI